MPIRAEGYEAEQLTSQVCEARAAATGAREPARKALAEATSADANVCGSGESQALLSHSVAVHASVVGGTVSPQQPSAAISLMPGATASAEGHKAARLQLQQAL